MKSRFSRPRFRSSVLCSDVIFFHPRVLYDIENREDSDRRYMNYIWQYFNDIEKYFDDEYK